MRIARHRQWIFALVALLFGTSFMTFGCRKNQFNARVINMLGDGSSQIISVELEGEYLSLPDPKYPNDPYALGDPQVILDTKDIEKAAKVMLESARSGQMNVDAVSKGYTDTVTFFRVVRDPGGSADS